MEIARDNIIKHETQKVDNLASVSTSSKEGKSTNSKDSDTADTTIIPTITIADKANANIQAGSSLSQIETESEITKSEDPCDVTGPENLHKSAYEMITTKSKQSTLNFAAKANKAEVPKSDLSLESKIDNLVREFQDFKLSIGKKINVGLNERQKPLVLSSNISTNISCHISTGSDMGNIGHGRKQFLEILHASEIWLYTKAAKYLTTPLFPHHYLLIFMCPQTSQQFIV